MRKINIKIVAVALVLLSLLAGGLTAKHAVAPSGFGQGDQGSGGGG